MATYKTILLLSSWVVLLFSSCTLSESELKRSWWKYSAGYHVEDVVDFNNGYSISQDTLLQNGQKIGIIVSRTKTLFGDNRIEIASLDSGQVGLYYQK